MHLVRDIIVAVVGGLVALVIGLIVADATRTQQVWVYVGALAVCGLVLGAQQLPGLIKRRRDAFKAEVIAAARDQILAELDSRLPEPGQSGSAELAFGGMLAGSPLDEATKLAVLLEQGRVLQGGLRSLDAPSMVLNGDEAAAIGHWEGRARAALVHMQDCLRDFVNAEGFDGIGISRGEAYRRMGTQLAALERAIRELDKAGDG